MEQLTQESVTNRPAIRLWFPSGQTPRDSDFENNAMACEWWALWDAVEDVGRTITAENKPVGFSAWIKCDKVILDENSIVLRYRGGIGRPRDFDPRR